MDNVVADERFIIRYLIARARLRNGDLEVLSGFELQLKLGLKRLRHGILVDPRTRPVITADHQDPDFFAAILNNKDGAMSELDADELAAWRKYVLDGGAPPLPSRTN
jgi:hypothetical protein